MADDEAEGVVLAVFSKLLIHFCGLIFAAGLQNPLYKSRMFAVSEDPGWILNGTLLTSMSAQTPSVRQAVSSVTGWIPKGYGSVGD